jgi:hypothetical protein
MQSSAAQVGSCVVSQSGAARASSFLPQTNPSSRRENALSRHEARRINLPLLVPRPFVILTGASFCAEKDLVSSLIPASLSSTARRLPVASHARRVSVAHRHCRGTTGRWSRSAASRQRKRGPMASGCRSGWRAPTRFTNDAASRGSSNHAAPQHALGRAGAPRAASGRPHLPDQPGLRGE